LINNLYSHIPAPLRGLGITFIITGLMGIAFMSFMGITYVDEPKKDKKSGTSMIEDTSVLRADVLDSSFNTMKK